MMRGNWKITSLIIIALIVSTVAFVEYRRINMLKDQLGCAATWLEKAKSLHTVQMNDPSKFKFTKSAYFCATKDPVSGHGPDAARSFGQYGVLSQR